jgi:hypothetical protein
MIAIVAAVANTRALPGRAWSTCPWVTTAHGTGCEGSM